MVLPLLGFIFFNRKERLKGFSIHFSHLKKNHEHRCKSDRQGAHRDHCHHRCVPKTKAKLPHEVLPG